MGVVAEALSKAERSLVADLACEYMEKKRDGEEPDVESYLAQLPSKAARDKFVVSTNMSMLLLAARAVSRVKAKRVNVAG